MTPSVTVDAEGTVTGNTYDKYGSTNPVVKRLMAGFERTLEELFAQAKPQTLLDVGCGEGVLVQEWAKQIPGRVVGIDLEDPHLQAEWAKRQVPNLEYKIMKPRTCRSPTTSSRWPRRSRCSSTCPTRRTRWPRWRAAPPSICW